MTGRRRTAVGRLAARAAGLVLVLALPPCAARAGQESAGTRAASFLAVGTSPSVLAMGGAGLGSGRDLQGATLNPASLGWLAVTEAAASHATFADQSRQEWLAAGGRAGGSLRWGLSGVYRDEGAIEGRDAAGNVTGTLAASSTALALQLARPLGAHVVAGGAVRYVSEQVAFERGTGIAFDAGLQARLGALAVGLAARNFGGAMRWGGQRWSLPASAGAGLAYVHAASGLTFALDVQAPANYFRSAHAGAQWAWRDRLVLRGGWRRELGAPADERLQGPAFGVGAGAGALWMDYGYDPAADGAGSHRVALTLRMPRTAATALAPAR